METVIQESAWAMKVHFATHRVFSVYDRLWSCCGVETKTKSKKQVYVTKFPEAVTCKACIRYAGIVRVEESSK